MPNKILIVEDDESIQYMYKVHLQSQGFDVATASNGREGLAAIESQRPDLVLLDLHMPEMDGEEMLSRLRKTEQGTSIKVIILTNVSKQEAPMALRMLHVSRYIVKVQYTPKQVSVLIREVLASDST